MGVEELGPWDPMTVAETLELFSSARFRWWLAGGHALEAHLGRGWRSHDDIDIGISRSDTDQLRLVRGDWDVHLASDGVLTRWDGQSLDDRSDNAGNNLWCRPSPDAPWALDILIGDGDEDDWLYRRDPSIRRPRTRSAASNLAHTAPGSRPSMANHRRRPMSAPGKPRA